MNAGPHPPGTGAARRSMAPAVPPGQEDAATRRLRDIEAIKQLKYTYLRCVDLKRWSELRECFAEDARSAYGDGRYSFEGRERILEFLIERMDRPTFVTFHHCHHPEIRLTSSTTAAGVWAMEGMGIDLEAGTVNHCAAHYHDEYVKRDGRWQIARTGYTYVYDLVERLADRPSLRLTENRFAPSSNINPLAS